MRRSAWPSLWLVVACAGPAPTSDERVVDDPCPGGVCPILDADPEGAIESLDECPEAPETVNGHLDEDGCPDEVKEWSPSRTRPPSPLDFLSYSVTVGDELTPTARAALRRAMERIAVPPGSKLWITGHADKDEGEDDSDLFAGRSPDGVYVHEVGQRRAQMVADQLVKWRLVERDQLMVQGYVGVHRTPYLDFDRPEITVSMEFEMPAGFDNRRVELDVRHPGP